MIFFSIPNMLNHTLQNIIFFLKIIRISFFERLFFSAELHKICLDEIVNITVHNCIDV